MSRATPGTLERGPAAAAAAAAVDNKFPHADVAAAVVAAGLGNPARRVQRKQDTAVAVVAAVAAVVGSAGGGEVAGASHRAR
jgi:hypothetical protein